MYHLIYKYKFPKEDIFVILGEFVLKLFILNCELGEFFTAPISYTTC